MDTASPIFDHPMVEPLPEARQKGFHVRSFRKTCVDFHWHFHLELELVHVVKGRGVRYAGHSVEAFSDGDFCLLGSNLPHAFGSHPADRKGAEWIVAHFLPVMWGAPFWELPEVRRIRSLLLRSQRGICFNSKEARSCVTIFRQLEQTLGARIFKPWRNVLLPPSLL